MSAHDAPTSRAEFLKSEFESIRSSLTDVLPQVRGKTLLLTGATGFFGKWLVGFFSHLIARGDCDVKILAVSRNSRSFLTNFPFVTPGSIQWIDADLSKRGDLERALPAGARFDFILHAATPGTLGIYENHPVEAFHTMNVGMETVLELARTQRARVLFTSSGAVYGKQPSEISHLREDFTGGPVCTDYRSVYGEAKRMNETLCAAYGKEFGVETVIARCFAFVGPFLPLDEHFAVGNFIGDCLAQRPITILGDGTPHRSYLYSSDLVVGLLKLLVQGRAGHAYNLGSDESVSIETLALRCVEINQRELNGNTKLDVDVKSKKTGAPPARYVPSIEKMKAEMGFAPTVSLSEGISRTFRWHRLSK